MSVYVWLIISVVLVWAAYNWGHNDGYKTAIGRPVPMAYLRRHFRGYFVKLPSEPSDVRSALFVDRTAKTDVPAMYIRADKNDDLPLLIDIGCDWRGPQE